VLTDIDLTAELAWHEERGASATLALVEVEDTSHYGVVPTDADGRVEAFLEKSDTAPTNHINAGVYVLGRDVIEGIPGGRPVSFEREVFPALAGGELFGFATESPYWIDIGTPERYLEATWDLLAGRVSSSLPARDETGSLVLEGSLVAGAHVGPQTVLGRSCSVGTDARVERAVLHDRVVVGADAAVRESVLAERVRVGEGASLGPGALIGAGASIGDGASVGEGARLDPGVEIEAGGRVAPGQTVA
jgi:mannose-1-phosphate guanylyltransferase